MLQANVLKLFLLISLCSVSIFAQNFTEVSHQKIRRAVENRDYQTAINELQNLEKSDAKLFALNNYDYLMARMAEKNGDLAMATAKYQETATRNSVLSEYALWHLSQIARSSGNFMLERIYLQKISTLAPESLLGDAVSKRLARSYFESKNFQMAIQMLSNQSAISNIQLPAAKDKGQRTKDDSQNRENQILLGEAYQFDNQISQAREIFTKLITILPNPAQPDDYALEAAKNLDLLDGGSENFGKSVPPLSDGEHYRRALIYQFNRSFPLARLHFQAVVERFPNSSFYVNSLYQIARGFAQEGNYSKAIDWFERVQSEFPNDDIARDALSQTASAYAKVNKPKEAISRYQKFIQTYPNAGNSERAYLNIVDILRDQGEENEALKWTAKTQTDFRGKLPEAIALFAQARIHISQNNWANALADLNILLTMPDLGGTKVPGGTNKAEITFLKGLTLENLNRFSEAIDVYLSISDGRNEYYGGRATERLMLLANQPQSQPFIERKKNYLIGSKDYQPLYRLTKGKEYLELIKNSTRKYQIIKFRILSCLNSDAKKF